MNSLLLVNYGKVFHALNYYLSTVNPLHGYYFYDAILRTFGWYYYWCPTKKVSFHLLRKSINFHHSLLVVQYIWFRHQWLLYLLRYNTKLSSFHTQIIFICLITLMSFPYSYNYNSKDMWNIERSNTSNSREHSNKIAWVTRKVSHRLSIEGIRLKN